MTRKALGRGLSALIPASEAVFQGAATQAVEREPWQTPVHQELEIDLIDPSPYQPRSRFSDESLDELTRSIQASGVIQPLVVRPRGPRFQLVAGERRWRAAQRAGLQRVPAMIRRVPDELALEITLIENLQREDLNPIEQAAAFERLIQEFHFTQEQIAERTGKDRATIANAIRLLKLEPPIQEMIQEGSITAGHARALLAIDNPQLRTALARRVARGGLTVRQLERLTKRAPKKHKASSLALDANTQAAIEEIQRALGTRVLLRPPVGKRAGQLILEYYNDSDLDRLYSRLISDNSSLA